MILNIILITFIITYIIDYSGFIIDFSKMIYKLLNPGKVYVYQVIKPFGCSLCLSFWIVTGYLLIIGQPLILSTFLGVICGGFLTVIYKKIIGLFYKLINLIK